MNKNIVISFALLLTYFSYIYGAHPSIDGKQIELAFNATILTIDKSSPSRNEVICELLALQKSLIVSLQKPIPEENQRTGFLLVPMTPEYVSHLLDQKEGCIVCAYLDQTLVGYILLTGTSEFKELYQDETVGLFESSDDLSQLNSWLAKDSVGYIEQIAVRPGYSKMGIGSQLIATSKQLNPQGLIADVFIHPVMNEASLMFFSHLGFTRAGLLHQYSTANGNFPYAHRTQVFFWNLQ